MLFPNNQELAYIRILIILPICIGVFYIIFKPNYEEIKQFTAKKVNKENNPEFVSKNTINNRFSSQLLINAMTQKEMRIQLGIHSSQASLIVNERKKRFFSNWEDFKERLPSLAPRVNEFKQLGAKIGGL